MTMNNTWMPLYGSISIVWHRKKWWWYKSALKHCGSEVLAHGYCTGGRYQPFIGIMLHGLKPTSVVIDHTLPKCVSVILAFIVWSVQTNLPSDGVLDMTFVPLIAMQILNIFDFFSTHDICMSVNQFSSLRNLHPCRIWDGAYFT